MKEHAKLHKTHTNRKSHVIGKRLSNQSAITEEEKMTDVAGEKFFKGADGKPIPANKTKSN